MVRTEVPNQTLPVAAHNRQIPRHRLFFPEQFSGSRDLSYVGHLRFRCCAVKRARSYGMAATGGFGIFASARFGAPPP
jgi:hypothetical protein